MSNRLTVWWDGRVTGCLYIGPDGDTQFAYDAAWLADATVPALSFSLPKQAEPFNRRACQPFFGGILPEEGQRTAIARALGCLLSLAIGGLGFLWIVFDDDRQAWHDKIAGTAVVKVPKGVSLL